MAFEQIKAFELLKQFQLSETDLQLIRDFGQLPAVDVQDLIDDFYHWLADKPWYQDYFSNGVPPRVKALQCDYWRDFLTAQVNENYVERRIVVGKVHATINLPVTAYLAGMNFAQTWLNELAKKTIKKPEQCLALLGAISRLIQMDSNIVMHVYALQSMDIIRQQGELTKSIVSEATRIATTAATGDFSKRYTSQDASDELEAPINQLIESLSEVSTQAREIAEGNYDIVVTPRNQRDELGLSMSQMIESLQGIGRVAESVAQGNYDVALTPRSDKDRLSRAMNQMVKNLKQFSVESEREKWVKSGLADLAVVMRGGLSISELADKVISFLAEYLGAQVGVFYVTETDGSLSLAASYAYTRRKHLSEKIRPGEGLVGQALKEQKPILLSNVPEDYIAINSGLGEHAPNNIIVQPLVYERKVTGIIELGAFQPLGNDQLDLLRQVSETIAVSVNSAQDREKMQLLLEESQQTSEELQAQQEELKAANETLEEQAQALKQSEEELTAQKDMLQTSNHELQRKTKDLEHQKAEIELARGELQQKAEQLAVTSKYKSEFLANMSHELRTPLNSLLLLSQSLLSNKENNLNTEQIEDLEVIYGGGKSLLTLINDILDLSKVEAGKLRVDNARTNLHELSDKLQQLFRPVADEKGLQFNVQIDSELAADINTDAHRVEQILRNLLSNAFKFTHHGQVQLLITQADNPVLQDTVANDYLAFKVQDTGIGIPKAKTATVFEAFQQVDGSTSRSYGGTGLGLTISRELAKLLGGEILLSSEEGKGSTFTLVLPKHRPNLAASVAEDAHQETASDISARYDLLSDQSLQPVPAPDNYVLIVEDDAEFAEQLSQLAEAHGLKSLITDQGLEALKLVLSHAPKAVILDMGLPDTNGLQVLESLKASPDTRNIPVHIVSANKQDMQSLKQGALGFLTKPLSMEELDKVFAKFETLLQKNIKHLLLIEDDKNVCRAMQKFLQDKKLEIHVSNSGEQAIELLQQQHIDCCILDLSLPDMSGFDFLEHVNNDSDTALPPVIIYTGKELSEEEYKKLMQYTDKIVIKDEQSPERLQEEVDLFLHSVADKLPASLKTSAALEQRTLDVDLNNRKILVVDDDLRNVYALSKVLKQHGLKVVLADNGKLALDKLREDSDVELILMDIMMPVMDGYEAMKHIRSDISSTVPIIALTAKAMASDREKCIAAGANDYMAKPVDVNNLLSMVKVWLYH